MSIRHLSVAELRGLGESQVLESKSSASSFKEAFADLSGMVNANSGKGTVVFGVEPNGNVCGLGDTNLDALQQKLAHHAGQKVDPPLQLEIHPAVCEGKSVLLMSASRHRSVPYHEYDGRAYVREGSATRHLSVREKQSVSLSRNRDLHNGPWICDRCGASAGNVSCAEIAADGSRKKVYRHSCGGEWWPAT